MPPTVHCSRHIEAYSDGIANLNHMVFALLVIIVQIGHFQVRAECQNNGCLLTAADILYDEYAKDALYVLRQVAKELSINTEKEGEDYFNGSNRSSPLREKALSSLRSAGDDTKITLTLRGYKGGRVGDQINQDRAMVVSPFEIIPGELEQNPTSQLLGVFDGHGKGGEQTSQYAMENIPSLLAVKLASIFSGRGAELVQGVESNNELKVVEALKQTFDEIDKNDPSHGRAGSTATVVLRLGEKIYIANAGDSVSFVGVYFGGNLDSQSSQKNVHIAYQSREDKPDLPGEKARIMAAGGYVHIPPHSNGDVPRAYYIDQNGQAKYGLAMSRSIGDWEVPGVISEPIVDVLDMSELVEETLVSKIKSCTSAYIANYEHDTNEKNQYCDFLSSNDVHIFAASISDGMMDYLDLEVIGTKLVEAFFDKSSHLHPHTAAEKLIIDAAKGWEDEFKGGYRDDIIIASFVMPL
mmetsp:Transcript_25388/g.59462  ORF Transcript_25388/g.59462 Transcript_25388/m.59462 type:complete len:467 (+) Transcript_25388:39-1439(+)